MEFRRYSWKCLTCGRLRRGLKDKATLIRFVPVELSIHFSYLCDCTWLTEGVAVLFRCIFSGWTPVSYWHGFFGTTSIRSFKNFHVRSGTPNFLSLDQLSLITLFFFYKFDSTPQLTIARASSTGVALKSPGGVSSPFGCRPLVTWLRTSHRRSTGNRKKTYQSISTQLAKSWIHRIFLSNWKHNDRLAKFRAPKKKLNFFKWNH